MVRIEQTERSLEDLNDLHDYTARDSENYPHLFVKKIYETAQKLKDFPNIGRVFPEVNNPSVREIIFHNYRIVYRNMDNYVEIITVIHGSRLLRI